MLSPVAPKGTAGCAVFGLLEKRKYHSVYDAKLEKQRKKNLSEINHFFLDKVEKKQEKEEKQIGKENNVISHYSFILMEGCYN